MKQMTILLAAASIVFGVAIPRAQDYDRQLKAAMNTEIVDGNLKAAIEQYRKLSAAPNRVIAAKALIRLAECHQKLGDAEAGEIYERLVRDFGDQREASDQARARLLSLRSPSPQRAVQAARQIWNGPGVDASGSVSADGRFLSFTDWDTGDLAVRDLTTLTSRRLTNTGGWVASGDYAAESVFSPDGRQIAYNWFVENDFKNQLRVIPAAAADASAARVVLETERSDYLRPFTWTPDGMNLVVVRSLPDRTNQLGLVSVAAGTYRSLRSLEWRYPNRVSVSPDGRHLAYDAPANGNGSPRDIFVLAVDGRSELTAVEAPGNDASPWWSPDGSHLLFVSDRTGSNSLWSVRFETGRPVGSPVLVKPDVGRMAVLGITQRGVLHYQLPSLGGRNIYAVDLNDARAVSQPTLAVDRFVNANIGPSWSRDGEYLAYYSLRNPTVLVVRSVKTGQDRVITVPSGTATPFQSGPRWFPGNDAVLILVADAEGTGFGFYRLTLATAQTELLKHISTGSSSYDLSSDGKSIFYVVQHPKDGKLMRFDIDTRADTELKANEWFITLAVSPDGRQVAYVKSIREMPRSSKPSESPSVVEVVASSGGPAREIFRSGSWLGGARYNTLAWTPDQRFLLFGQDDGALWKVPSSGGQAEKMGISMTARIKAPAVHPSGTRLVFGASDQDTSELWTLENFLPVARR